MNREEEINNAGHMQYGKYAGGTPLECFKYGAAWADEHPKNPWVNIESQLPPEGIEILIFFENGKVEKAVFEGWGFSYCTNEDVRSNPEVLYWMPIPELNV